MTAPDLEKGEGKLKEYERKEEETEDQKKKMKKKIYKRTKNCLGTKNQREKQEKREGDKKERPKYLTWKRNGE